MYKPRDTGTIYDTEKHGFEPLPNDSVTCRYCERSFSDPTHHNVGDVQREIDTAAAARSEVDTRY